MKRFVFPLFLLLVIGCASVPKGDKGLLTYRDLRVETLSNGLTVIYIYNPVVPLVTIEIVSKCGAFVETPEFDGLAHLYEHMFFKGNELIPDQERYDEYIRELGISYNGATSTEVVSYYFTLPTRNMEKGMELMSYAIRTPLFDEKELERERQVVLNEYDRDEADPVYCLMRKVENTLYWKYTSRKDVIGSRDVIATATREKMLAIKNRFYVPNNCALVIAGDFDIREARMLARKYFGEKVWKRGDDPHSKGYPKHPPLTETKEVYVPSSAPVAWVVIEWMGPSVGENNAETYAADLLGELTRLKTGRFYRNLVKSGVFMKCKLGYYTQRHTGEFTFWGMCDPAKLETAKEAVFGELKKMVEQDDYFSEEDLILAKRSIEIDWIYSHERPSMFAQEVDFWWAVCGLDYYATYLDSIACVDVEDIKGVVAKYILDAPCVIGVAGKLDKEENK